MRYALYWCPDESDPLAAAGAAWLGRRIDGDVGNQIDFSIAPANLLAGTGATISGSPVFNGAIQLSLLEIGFSGSPSFAGRRAVKHASNHGIAR